MNKLTVLTALCGLLVMSLPAAAQDRPADLSYLSLGVGYYDIFDGDSGAADFRVEYRSGNTLFWKLKPWVGFEANDDGSVWGGGGVLADFKPEDNIYVTPAIGVGLYGQGGSDKDLGSVVEFRTQLEAGYEFTNGHRLGAAFSHISNAGLDGDNPGAEVLNLYYHVPIAAMF